LAPWFVSDPGSYGLTIITSLNPRLLFIATPFYRSAGFYHRFGHSERFEKSFVLIFLPYIFLLAQWNRKM
jgi:hypothetical protein